MLQSKKMVGKI